MYPQSIAKELEIRKNRIADALKEAKCDAILISDNANLYYTASRVYSGYTYITADGDEIYFVRRPIGVSGENVVYIRKPENIPGELQKLNIAQPLNLALELNSATYSEITRLSAMFPEAKIVNGSAIMREIRAVKSDYEIEQIKYSGIHHVACYERINRIYREGMTDIELQIELERVLRLEGSLGQFRISGNSMEIFMGSLLCGDNADNPTPYDFAMGGAGLSPSLPIGCNGTAIRRGNTVMVDLGGNFNGYMTDLSRTFRCGEVSELAVKAHNLSIKIAHTLAEQSHAGTATADMYKTAINMVEENGLSEYFMGHRQQAGFIGHGVGIEINEAPVLAPKSRDILKYGNVIAIEPKFVIPSVGAVGIENTYVVREDCLECLTNMNEELTELY